MIVGSFVLVRSQMLVFGLGLPVAEVVFGVVEDLARLGTVGVWLALITWNDGGAIQELKEAAAVASQDDLLLCPLDRGEEFGVVGFFELLASLSQQNISSISFRTRPGGGATIAKGMSKTKAGTT